VTLNDRCNGCGGYYHGSAPCVISGARSLISPTLDAPKVGWTCPVCGTGCAPTITEHCSGVNVEISKRVLHALIMQVDLDRPRPYWLSRWNQGGIPDEMQAWLSSLIDAGWSAPPATAFDWAASRSSSPTEGQ
jgi:hypothetical protein